MYCKVGFATKHAIRSGEVGHQMLLPQLCLIGSFSFHGVVARKSCLGFRSGLGSSTSVLFSKLTSGARTSRRISTVLARKMSLTEHQETKVVAGMRELCDEYDGFILDQFGVLHGERFQCFHHYFMLYVSILLA